MSVPAERSLLPAPFRWTKAGRIVVFLLSATSIWSLLAEFYGLCSMRLFVVAVFLPATIGLVALTVLDCVRGDGRLARAVMIGAGAGLIAAAAYDVFRLPFVFSHEWHLASVVPPMNLFKVFPRFGAMILGQSVEQPHYSLAAHLIGWGYHFSNGVTFGVMYLACVGDVRGRGWLWAVVLAVGLELGMLFTPYPQFFGIPLNARFVAVTLAAHLVFGIVLGLIAKGWCTRWFFESSSRNV